MGLRKIPKQLKEKMQQQERLNKGGEDGRCCLFQLQTFESKGGPAVSLWVYIAMSKTQVGLLRHSNNHLSSFFYFACIFTAINLFWRPTLLLLFNLLSKQNYKFYQDLFGHVVGPTYCGIRLTFSCSFIFFILFIC